MTSIEEVRQEVISAFKTVHDAHYSATLVNYPNIVVVDIEHQTAPFVSVELDLTKITKAALGEKELLVPGMLFVYFYYRIGTGMAGAYNYTDMLNTYLGQEQVGALYFHEAVPVEVQSFPGWKGLMHTMRFDVSSQYCPT